MQPTNLSEVVELLARQQREKQAAEMAEAQNKLITLSYDKAAAYTTVIVFGGYAGFFAIWQLSKEHLSKGQALWAALLVLLSLLAFVLFEVIKMIVVTRSIFKRAAVLRLPEVQGNPERLLAELNALNDVQNVGLRAFMVFWVITLIVAVGGALIGAAILGFAFISGLAR